jgi:hypothetical protein
MIKTLYLAASKTTRDLPSSLGQTHPWVVPLRMSHLDFPRPIQL